MVERFCLVWVFGLGGGARIELVERKYCELNNRKEEQVLVTRPKSRETQNAGR